MALIARGVEAEIRDILSVSRAAAIIGPRQSGKSTLALQLRDAGVVPNYYSLDEEGARRAAREDPDGFALALKRPATIDEIQRVPDLMLSIKQILDLDQTPGQFLITGSADLVTARIVADALPGRVEYVNLWPLSQAEMSERPTSIIDDLLNGKPPAIHGARKGRAASAEAVIAGGFPGVLPLTVAQRSRWFRSYVQSIVGRDLPEIGDTRIEGSQLEKLVRLSAARTGGLANFASLSRELEMTEKTVKAHLGLLRQLFVIYPLQPWFTNLGARITKAPKLYVCDSGLAASLVGFDTDRYEAHDQGAFAGMLFETFVVMELIKQATWSTTHVGFYFYRDAEKREVDVVLETAAGDVVAVEIKLSAGANPADARGLRHLRDRLGRRFKCGVIIYCGEHTLPFSDRIWAVPVSGLWQSPPASSTGV